jgi:hypothetical protein
VPVVSQVPNFKSHRGPVQRLEAVLLCNLRCPCVSFVNGCLISSSHRLGAKEKGQGDGEGEGQGEKKEQEKEKGKRDKYEDKKKEQKVETQ